MTFTTWKSVFGLDSTHSKPTDSRLVANRLPLNPQTLDAIAVEMYGRYSERGAQLPLSVHHNIVSGYLSHFGEIKRLGDVDKFYADKLTEIADERYRDWIKTDSKQIISDFWSAYKKDPLRTSLKTQYNS